MTKQSNYGIVAVENVFIHFMNTAGNKTLCVFLSSLLFTLFLLSFVNHVEFHPMGTCVAAACTDSTVKVRNTGFD